MPETSGVIFANNCLLKNFKTYMRVDDVFHTCRADCFLMGRLAERRREMAGNSADNRKSFRFALTASVDVMHGVERHAFGTLLNLSRDGAAIRSLSPLDLGRKYKFHIRGVGTWSGVVVRRFDGRSYGLRFETGEAEKRQIDRILMAMMDGDMDVSNMTPARPRIRAF